LGLAQIVRTGWYREVKVKKQENHNIRAVLGARAQLVGMRTEVINQIRGLSKNAGVVLPKGKLVMEGGKVEADNLLSHALRALCSVMESLNEQILQLNRRVEKLTASDARCKLLMTIPGVGPLTATAFVAAIDDPERFRKSKSVGAYLGLTPRRYQSGEVDLTGRISKCGDSLVRCYLYEAAGILLTRVNKWSALKAWGMKLARRSGAKKARVALARKLAVLMHRMLCTGEVFRWAAGQDAAA